MNDLRREATSATSCWSATAAPARRRSLEAMLFTSGAITRMGTVEDGNTVSDHDPEEISARHQRLALDGADRMERREDQRPRRARLRRLHRRRARGDPGRRRVHRRRLRRRRRRGPDRGRLGAGRRGRPAARDLRQQARPRTRVVRATRSTSWCRRSATRSRRSSSRSARSTSSPGVADLLRAKADRYPSGPIAEEGEWPDELHAMADPSARS